MNVIEDNNIIFLYKTLISSLVNNNLITYECEDNIINMNILNKLGFEKSKGFIELEKEFKNILIHFLMIELVFL